MRKKTKVKSERANQIKKKWAKRLSSDELEDMDFQPEFIQFHNELNQQDMDDNLIKRLVEHVIFLSNNKRLISVLILSILR